jgi:tetratricopeptide (TPR) repeat protein
MNENNQVERSNSDESLSDQLALSGYWPARAAKLLLEGKYSGVVEICREHLEGEPDIVSGRLIYAIALYRAGQVESAVDQFYHVLSRDPDNLVALKYLGDIKFAAGDELTALANYRRILEIDPYCRGVKCEVRRPDEETTHTVTLRRKAERGPAERGSGIREIPFFTETMGDLYLAQGYARLAAAVYQQLADKSDNPRLKDKLIAAEKKIREREP